MSHKSPPNDPQTIPSRLFQHYFKFVVSNPQKKPTDKYNIMLAKANASVSELFFVDEVFSGMGCWEGAQTPQGGGPKTHTHTHTHTSVAILAQAILVQVAILVSRLFWSPPLAHLVEAKPQAKSTAQLTAKPKGKHQ